ncbi:hypothetical protein GCM10010136_15800 [Limoniibacter endophyticus]|uniref:Uncharacterized protein n=1 Tax=Limoniibacter endophyticus TaxID=1565040 RepID=A0A8J3DIB5_9HYPH|nr:hypothetical protein GCM10010136_15800 [Limoniibacter endophyticus]
MPSKMIAEEPARIPKTILKTEIRTVTAMETVRTVLSEFMEHTRLLQIARRYTPVPEKSRFTRLISKNKRMQLRILRN